MKTIKTCFIIATLCIVFLTGLAGYLLISNINTSTSKVLVPTEQYGNSAKSSNKESVSNNQSEGPSQEGVSNDSVSLGSDDYRGFLDSIVSNTTLVVNSVNNILSTSSIFLGIITLFIGLVGLFGYHSLKDEIKNQTSSTKDSFDRQIEDTKDSFDRKASDATNSFNRQITDTKDGFDRQINDAKESLNRQITDTKDGFDRQINDAKESLNRQITDTKDGFDRQITDTKNGFDRQITDTKNGLDRQISSFSSIFNKSKDLVKSADELKQSLVAQQTYIEKSNESLIKAVYAIANYIQDKKIARELLKQQSHYAEIINLYRPCINPENLADVSNKKIASLLYFQANGNNDDLPHLKYVAENDIDSKVVAKAQEVIIRIELRQADNGDTC